MTVFSFGKYIFHPLRRKEKWCNIIVNSNFRTDHVNVGLTCSQRSLGTRDWWKRRKWKSGRLMCFVRTEIPCASLTSLTHADPQRPSYEFPCSHWICPQPNRKISHPTGSPVNQTRCTHLVLNLMGSPACQPHNYSNKPIICSWGNQRSPHPLVTTNPASHNATWFNLLLSTIPMWPCMVWSVLLPCTVGMCDW